MCVCERESVSHMFLCKLVPLKIYRNNGCEIGALMVISKHALICVSLRVKKQFHV